MPYVIRLPLSQVESAYLYSRPHVYTRAPAALQKYVFSFMRMRKVCLSYYDWTAYHGEDQDARVFSTETFASGLREVYLHAHLDNFPGCPAAASVRTEAFRLYAARF